MITHFILYVKDQNRSAAFYSALLKMTPCLDVPGMTEFALSTESVLGLMPETGITRLLGSDLPNPAQANGIPRAEVYLVVDDAYDYFSRAVGLGAKSLSDPTLRDWGHIVGYCLDKDGHVLAFAQSEKT